jgi:hypothetical protein
MDINIAPGETLEEAQAAEPIPFKVVGHQRDDKGKVKVVEYGYECNSTYPFGAFTDFLEAVGSGRGGAQLLEFVLDCLANDEERERFRAMLDATRHGLSLNPDLLDLLSNSLIAAYTNRPTRRPSASAGGPSRGARRSAAGANGRA